MRSVDSLDKRGSIEKYKAKNRRVRLINETANKVYGYYVRELQRAKYSFLKDADRSGFKARSVANRSIVKVSYVPLEGSTPGTLVGVAVCIGQTGAPKDIKYGVSKWVVPSVMREWANK